MNPPVTASRGSFEVIRRLSIDTAVYVGALSEEDCRLQQSALVAPAPDNNLLNNNSHYDDAQQVINNPVSIFRHTGRSNLDAIVSALPAFALILVSNMFVGFITSKGGVWGDRHAALCAVCMSLIEVGFFTVNSRNYMVRRLLIGIPVNITCNVLASCFLFDWHPGGAWVPLIMTTSWWISICAAYPLMAAEHKASDPFFKYAKTSFFIAFSIKGGVVSYIYALVLPTRLLAKSDNDILTLLVTGLVFPGCAFVARKILTSLILNQVSLSGRPANEKVILFINLSKGISSLIMFLPTVLMFLNTSIKLALVSALAHLVTENVGKICIVMFMKRGMEEELAGAAGDPSVVELLLKKHKHKLAMLAIRWNSELVAEKGSIINAALVAYLYLSDLMDASPIQLALIGGVFFAVEVMTDVIFVYSMHIFFDVPILSALPNISVLSKENLFGATALSFGFTTMAVCIAMAASVPL
jgi:hypothetical protein